MVLSRSQAAMLFIALLVFGVAAIYTTQRSQAADLRAYIEVTNNAAYEGCLYRNSVLQAARQQTQTLLAAELADPETSPVRSIRLHAFETYLDNTDQRGRDCRVYMEDQ